MTENPKTIFEALRPRAWLKNAFIFAGAVFAEKLLLPGVSARLLLGFGLFSLGAGAVYLFNDMMDVQKDRQHPYKAKRPYAAGRLEKKALVKAASVMVGLLIPLSYFLDTGFALWVLGYLGLNALYSLKLKHMVLIDVMTIAAGYVMRVMAGCSLAQVVPSGWLITCTLTLSLLLGLCKRRQELVLFKSAAEKSRRVLKDYSIRFLDQMITIMTAATLITYILYTLSSETVLKLGTRALILTSPFVFYGIFRYLHLIYRKQASGEPIDALFSDPPMLISVILWILAVLVIIYGV